MAEPSTRARIEFEGIVQGVGFRPFLHKLAIELQLAGWVLNSSAGVLLEVEGPRGTVEEYVRRVQTDAPPLSRVLVTKTRYMAQLGLSGFLIEPSQQIAGGLTLLCPDVATCPDCLRELFDPADRRYRYPFINCTSCGPRYTIVSALPYDRPQTTMADFPLCPDCLRDYHDVADRRYHAQPVACPACGPRLWLEAPAGIEVAAGDALEQAINMLLDGGIVGIKGLGGFHLACRADSDAAVQKLRLRKGRSFFKPLAVMVPDVETAERICRVSPEAKEWLGSPLAPIVLLPLQAASVPGAISRFVAPNLDRLGVMLPYTPLHHLLLAGCGIPLVMTSGNLSDEPIVADNEVALQQLAPLADAMLLHDRPIQARCDDSVLLADDMGECCVLRHSRGFAPFPLALPEDAPAVLALGGDIKTTFAVSRGHFAFLSPHLGDADQLATYALFRETWEHYRSLFGIIPEAVACDMHPGYHTARWAQELALELQVPLIKVQHHHAHLAALLAERGLAGPLPAFIADGTGYGTDGTIWGGEILYGDAQSCERVAYLRPIKLAGGDEAVRQPWRIAMTLIEDAAPEAVAGYERQLFDGSLAAKVARQLPGRLEPQLDPGYIRPVLQETGLVRQILNNPAYYVLSSALGRLFDGVAALLGVTLYNTYEGQAPMELEAIVGGAKQPTSRTVPASGIPDQEVDWRPLIRHLLDCRWPIAQQAWLLHQWVASAFVPRLVACATAHGVKQVLASGGCMQNATLLRMLRQDCQRFGLELITHRELPANDGGLAVGVLRIAQAQLRSR